jgi:beta-lactamase regulating signal transducer with metallopeptidase domain
MRTISQMLLTFLLNACWQIVLITLAAALCAWLLRGTAARYRHRLWVIALASSFAFPLLTSAYLLDGKSSEETRAQVITQRADTGSFSKTQLLPVDTQAASPMPVQQAGWFVPIGRNMAALVIVVYLLLLGYRSGKLLIAWRRTRVIAGSAYTIDIPASLQSVISECQAALGISRVRILCSTSVAVPITVGIRDPLVILPEQLLQEAERDVLTSAIGHELVHVLRRDYLLNLFYELIALPLAFHPATALLKRRIRETRELGCDELVTDRLLEPAVYARSLVQLAGAAITVGPSHCNHHRGHHRCRHFGGTCYVYLEQTEVQSLAKELVVGRRRASLHRLLRSGRALRTPHQHQLAERCAARGWRNNSTGNHAGRQGERNG